ncbi:MAG: trypsin-like serine protease [Candidatus Thioglobus sp.]
MKKIFFLLLILVSQMGFSSAQDSISNDPPKDSTFIKWLQQSDGSYHFINKRTRIIGGNEAPKNTYPWMTAILNTDGSWYGCGASLIAPNWVLTAAHCTENLSVNSPNINVVIGRHDISSNEGEVIRVIRVYNHPEYNSATIDNDLALLELENSSSALPVDIINPSVTPDIIVGSMARVMGWGNMSMTGEDYPEDLMQVDVPIVSNSTCNSPQSYDGDITKNMLCAGITQGGIDACQGDSGGPLIEANSTSFMQVGIVSWGAKCAAANYYGVYTRLSQFYSWIYTTTDGDIGNKKPTTPSEVNTSPIEGNSNHINYFLLEISSILDVDSSVDFTTKNGTAIAGEDYIATSGVATIIAGEPSTTIGIEIIGDTVVESDETFYLVINNPKEGIFPEDVTEVTASRTIIDDDTEVIEPPMSYNELQTRRLTGNWTFEYTIISTFPDDYYLYDVVESTSSLGEYNIFGTDTYGNHDVIAKYDPSYEMFFLLDAGYYFDQFYAFNFTATDSISGCYYMDIDGSLSNCYPMDGVRNKSKVASIEKVKSSNLDILQKLEEGIIIKEVNQDEMTSKKVEISDSLRATFNKLRNEIDN